MSESVKTVSGTSSKDSGAGADGEISDQRSEPTNRGNGAEVGTDGDYNALLSKASSIESSRVSEGNSYASEHGDVGRAGSYRIDWKTVS